MIHVAECFKAREGSQRISCMTVRLLVKQLPKRRAGESDAFHHGTIRNSEGNIAV